MKSTAARFAALIICLCTQAIGENTPDSYADTIKGHSSSRGLMTFHQKTGSLKLEIPGELLGEALGFAAIRSNAAGDFAPRSGGLDTQLVRWQQVGDHLVLYKENLDFRAAPGSDIESTVEDTFSDSPVFSASLLALEGQPSPLMVDAGKLFDTGLVDIVDPDSGWKAEDPKIERIQVFDDNVIARVRFTLKSKDNGKKEQTGFARWRSRGRLADQRSASATVDFHFFKLPEDGFQPRLADERIGGMLLSYKDYTDVDDRDTLFNHLLRRWDVRKAHPDQGLSPPLKPITFYIDHSVPKRWRGLVREATLWWNVAFEDVGIRDAIQVLDPPEDPDWNPADLNHSVIFWHLTDDLVFSGLAGPIHVDPRTGQVIKANVWLNGEFFSFALNRYLVYAWWRAPEPGEAAAALAERRMMNRARSHPAWCDRQASFSSQIAFARLVLQARGVLQPGTREADRFAREAFRELVAHEVGHALGFPHNWKASLVSSWEDVRDGNVSGRRDQNMFSASVMDYDPIYFAPPGQDQGDYFMQEIGDYDRLWVDYIYRPFPGLSPSQTTVELDRIAARAETSKGLTYDNGMLNSIDPTDNADDLGDDPLAFAEDRLHILRHEVLPRLPELVLAEGHDFSLLRQALDSAIFSVAMDYIDMTARHVGGQILFKRVANSPASPEGGPPPVTPVSAERQRQALSVLDRHLFARGAFAISPDFAAQLKADMLPDWNYPWRHASDYHVGDRIAGLYDTALTLLLEPERLKRIMDNERMLPASERFTLPELFTHLEQSVFDDGEMDVDRRALQRLLLKKLLELVEDAPDGAPAEASQLAATSLGSIREQVRGRLKNRRLGAYQQAHFKDIERRVTEVLHPER